MILTCSVTIIRGVIYLVSCSALKKDRDANLPICRLTVKSKSSILNMAGKCRVWCWLCRKPNHDHDVSVARYGPWRSIFFTWRGRTASRMWRSDVILFLCRLCRPRRPAQVRITSDVFEHLLILYTKWGKRYRQKTFTDRSSFLSSLFVCVVWLEIMDRI